MQKTPDFMPEFRANLPRTSHVLSHDFHFTASTGHLNPIFHTIVSPGEKINLGFNFNLRTMPLEAAAFANLTCHTEYFFVPMSLLYQPFDSVYYGVTDQWSSMFPTQEISRKFPVLDFTSLVTQLYNVRSSSTPLASTIYVGESIGQSSIRLFDMLGYNPTGIAMEDSEGTHFLNPNVFPYPILAYNCIYQYYYRLDTRETFDQSSFNWDKFYSSANPIDKDSYSYKYLLMRYRPLGNDYFTDVKVSPIVDVLNLADKSTLQVVNGWLAQNTNVNGDKGSINSGIYTTFRQKMANPDVIQSQDSSVYPSPSTNNISDVDALLNVGGPLIWDDELSGSLLSEDGFLSLNTGDEVYESRIRTPHKHAFTIIGDQINTANLRAMFANEKLWSITGRAKKNYDDQTLAHFGFKVPHDVKHEISCFGHDISKIHIGEVISTSDTSGAPLGEIAGKGYGSQNVSAHSFTAPCHGVIMAIFSVVVDRNYEGGIAKENVVIDASDLYQPEYDHLGMQPLFGYECNYYDYPDAHTEGDGSIIYGWQYRYEQWKRRYNRVTGVFRNTSNGTLKSWVPSYVPYNGNELCGFGDISLPNQANQQTFTHFQNYPTDVNQVFLAQYPYSWSSSFETYNGWSHVYDFDPFVVSGNIDAVLVSTMSDYSLPRLDS